MNISFYTENDVTQNNKVGSTKYIKQIVNYYEELNNCSIELKIIEKPKSNIFMKVIGMFYLLFFNVPFQIYLRKKNGTKIENANEELTLIESIYLAPFVTSPGNSILLAQDSLSRLQFSIAETKKSFLSRIYYIISGFAYLLLEKKIYKKFKKVFFVSNQDKQYVASQFGYENLDVLEIGLDKQDLCISNNKELEENIFSEYGEYIIFTGNMNYPPNQYGCEVLVNEIFPVIKKMHPNLKLLLAGIGSEKYTNIESNVVGLGKVKSLKEYIYCSQIYVSPLFSGSGMKNKVLEALAQQSVVIATPKSVEGIGRLYENIHYLKAETVTEIIKGIEEVLNHSQDYKEIKEAGYQYILENHMFSVKNKEKLNELIVR